MTTGRGHADGRSLAVLALAFLALGYPGRNGTATGAWMVISGLGFLAFLLTVAVMVVLTGYLLVTRRRARRTGADR